MGHRKLSIVARNGTPVTPDRLSDVDQLLEDARFLKRRRPIAFKVLTNNARIWALQAHRKASGH